MILGNLHENLSSNARFGSNRTKISATFPEDRSTFILLINNRKYFVAENCALLGCYAASSGHSLPTFRDNLSAPSSRAKNVLKKV
jgi:hypothetical protein